MKVIAKVFLITGLLLAGNAWSARAHLTANVERILTISTQTFGGCMAQLDAAIASTGLNCRGNWVTFSCSGDFASKQDAKTNFEMIQLAFALGKQVQITADDSRTHNGYCFSDRVDVLK